MSRFPEGPVAIAALVMLAAWLLIGLPLFYLPHFHIPHELLGIKAGEFLIFAATVALWWATRQLVRGADKTAERQLRAYVMVDTVRIEGLEDGGKPTCHLTIKNSGSTPATNVTQWSRLGFSKYPDPQQIPQQPSDLLPQSPLAPGGIFHMVTGLDKPLNAATLAVLKSAAYAFYVVGQIRYTDAFGVARETDFLLFCSGAMVADGTMSSYNTGNRIT